MKCLFISRLHNSDSHSRHETHNKAKKKKAPNLLTGRWNSLLSLSLSLPPSHTHTHTPVGRRHLCAAFQFDQKHTQEIAATINLGWPCWGRYCISFSLPWNTDPGHSSDCGSLRFVSAYDSRLSKSLVNIKPSKKKLSSMLHSAWIGWSGKELWSFSRLHPNEA